MKKRSKKAIAQITTSHDEFAPRRFWAVMRAYSWSSISLPALHSITLRADFEGPHRFIPVFDTREQAVAWNNGSDVDVREMTVGE